jgi:hypothetical protein
VINVTPGVFAFQITNAGLAAELGITGANYFKDNGLNGVESGVSYLFGRNTAFSMIK